MVSVSSSDYLRLLEPWLAAADRYLYVCPGRPELIAYGTGYNNWGVQTNQKAFAAYAVLAADPGYDSARSGMAQDEVLKKALGLLRFSLASHIEGDYACLDGSKWGHTWISSLGIERMMHGVEAIRPHLTAQDRDRLRRVLISESDWLLKDYKVVAGLVDNNVPESNLWNGAVLHRTAAMYPDAPNAAAYQEKGTKFLINGISIEADAASGRIVDGRPVSDWYVGPNFYPSFALNHHRYLNVGYMVICLSNVAMLHFTFREWGREAPAAVYHHAKELWDLVKALTFPDGRLIRVGGDTRVRYCYCQDYAIPTWLMAADLWGDRESITIEKRWLDIVRHEMSCNGDGSYLSKRCDGLSRVSPLYYTRLESDRACTLSMGAHWRRVLTLASEGAEPEASGDFAWHDPYHGAVVHRSPTRLASWTWLAAERPQGLCLPPATSNLAEWRENLAGQLHGLGEQNFQEVIQHVEVPFPGGFLTWGRTVARSKQMAAEGDANVEQLAHQFLVAAALPDDTTMLLLQFAWAPPHRSYFSSIKGLCLRVPNDLFNGNRRPYHAESGRHDLDGVGAAEEVLDLRSRWVTIDGQTSVVMLYGADSLAIYRPGRRQIGLKHQYWVERGKAGGMLYCDEICAPCRVGLGSVDPGAVLYDGAFLLSSGMTPLQARAYAEHECGSRLTHRMPETVRAVVALAGGGRYLLVANVGDDGQDVILPEEDAEDLVTGQRTSGVVRVDGHAARLYRLGLEGEWVKAEIP